ncbi:hypothetical protein YQE_02338, partial [Dendroctonus ponderosae]
MESTTDLVTQSIADLTADETKKKKTIRERISYVKEVITVEPLIASYVLSAILVKPALLVLEYDKACRANLGLNETVCDNIVNSDDTIYLNETEQIQLLISDVHSWQLPIQSVMPLILVLFLGSYSDRHQWRKPFLLLPLIGELFAVAGCIISVLLMDTWSLEVQGVVQTVVPSFFGGQTMLTMAVFAYIADVSTLEMRTLRVGIVQIVINACVPTVQSFSAVLFTSIGYIGVLIIAGFLYLSGIIYGFFCIKEPKRPIKESKKNFLLDIFDTRHAIDTFKLILKKSPGNDRLFIVLLLLGMFVYTLVNVGEDSVFFLYTRGFLNWSIVQYTSFLTANTLIHLVGTIIAVPLFTKFLKLHDLVILLLSFLDKIVCNIFFGIAQDSVLMYVGAAVSLITGVTSISLRSLATKVVSENDLVCPNWKSIMYPDSEKNDQETFKDTIKRLKEVVTVEPLIAFYQMALFISKPALDNLEFEKACSHYSSENEEIQKIIISMHSWQQPLQSFSPLILVLFLGSFSDRHKWRKPFFLVPIVGELSGLVGCILCVIFMKQLPLEAQGISQKVIPSFFGGQTMLAMATTAYIADISTIEMRTLRLGESNVLYLYTQSVFQWTPLEYSYFLTVNSLVALAGHLFGVPLFTRVLHLSDSVILLIAIIDKIVTNLFFGLATGPRVFYAGVAVSIVTRVYRTAKKSIATKIVSKNDVGKAQSLLGICDVLAPALFVPIYNKIIYMETFHSFPAAFFFCSILLYGISCIFIITLRMGQFLCPDPSYDLIDPVTQEIRGCTKEGKAKVKCLAVDGLACEGTKNRTFTKEMPCRWTNGYHYDTSLLLSIFLGMFGIDRFYLGYPAIGLAKFCTLGFLFIGQFIDIILIASQVVGPADGSAYVIPYYGARIDVIRSDNTTYKLRQNSW